jgi:magnesium-transporting ATPase (P-type)
MGMGQVARRWHHRRFHVDAAVPQPGDLGVDLARVEFVRNCPDIEAGAIAIMHAERVGSDTLLAQIVAMVAEAQRSRAPIQRLVDVIAAWLVPSVIIIAVATFVAWSILGPAPAMGFALVNAVEPTG